MSLPKLVAAFKNCSGTFPYREFVAMIGLLGYVPLKRGKTGGSRRKFIREETGHKIILHEPHDGQMGPGTVKAIRDQLVELNLI